MEGNVTQNPSPSFTLFRLSPSSFGGTVTLLGEGHSLRQAPGDWTLPLLPQYSQWACDLSSANQTPGTIGVEQVGEWLEVTHLRSSSIQARRFRSSWETACCWGPQVLASMLPPAVKLLPTLQAPSRLSANSFSPKVARVSLSVVCNQHTWHSHDYTWVNDNPPKMQWLLVLMKKELNQASFPKEVQWE